MTRIIAHQRTQIGVLKAVGYRNRSIILHYMSYGFWPVLGGAILGLVLGLYLRFLFLIWLPEIFQRKILQIQ